jgi:nucleotide-binding universal stress UspA family protein
MTIALIALALLALALAALVLQHFGRVARFSRAPVTDVRRILFPFVAQALSTRALDAALRLAKAEDATLVPMFIAVIPAHLPLDATLTRQCAIAIPLQEAIEQRATKFGVPVDARIQRGRTYRHALRQTIDQERFDRIVIAAAARGTPGFDADDVAWLLNQADGEIVVLRPSKEEQFGPQARPGRRSQSRGHGRRIAAPAVASDDGRGGGTSGEPHERSGTRARLTA